MDLLNSGAIKLFRVFGITVLLHWSWILVAAFEMRYVAQRFNSPLWGVLEYLAFFGIVLLHEFGHALACQSVGGKAEEILLWPLGGVAKVRPPARPGAVLWSIAAGPLVNVLLIPVTVGVYAWYLAAHQLPADIFLHLDKGDDIASFLGWVAAFNFMTLIFNLLPIFPLDGGQIVQALLWFVIGRGPSLLVVSILGLLIGVGGVLTIAGLMLLSESTDGFLLVIAAFIALQSWQGFQSARAIIKHEQTPRHSGMRCPSCGVAPLKQAIWACPQCEQPFDAFDTFGRCPRCGLLFEVAQCVE